MLTLSEAMRRGYAMAEKYSKAAWRQGGKEGCAAVEARIALRRRRQRSELYCLFPMSIEDWFTGIVNLPCKGRG